MDGFEAAFGHAPEAVADAPGRVNLLGEHTDYNDGFVLPVAIPQRTRVALRRTPGDDFELLAEGQGPAVRFRLGHAPHEHFASYVYGCLMEAQGEGLEVPPLQVHVESEVPIGVGLSSSAALEVATLRALRTLLQAPLDDVRIAQLAQRAEIGYAGVNCGIMDQMASSLAATDRALLLDTRSLERRDLPLPPGSAVLVLDSGVSRSLAASGYNQRRAECEDAARRLGVGSLRDVEGVAALDGLPELLRRRARHVVTENARVLRAIGCCDPAQFGALMNESHASLRDDYQVSTPELDRLVDLLQQQAAVYGARLTGAGFGGACVALCEATQVAQVGTAVLALYAGRGHHGAVLVPPPG